MLFPADLSASTEKTKLDITNKTHKTHKPRLKHAQKLKTKPQIYYKNCSRVLLRKITVICIILHSQYDCEGYDYQAI